MNTRLALVSTEILRIAREVGRSELRMMLFDLLNSLATLAAATHPRGEALVGLTGVESAGIVTHAQALLSDSTLEEEDALQLCGICPF